MASVKCIDNIVPTLFTHIYIHKLYTYLQYIHKCLKFIIYDVNIIWHICWLTGAYIKKLYFGGFCLGSKVQPLYVLLYFINLSESVDTVMEILYVGNWEDLEYDKL